MAARERTSIAVIWRLVDGELEFLVHEITFIGYFSSQKPQKRFIGGMNDGSPEDRTSSDTLRLKILKETGLVLQDGPPLRIIHEPVTQDGHKKHFYLVPSVRLKGEMRVIEIPGRNSIMSPPKWIKGDDAIKRHSPDEIYKTHIVAARKAVKYLM